MHPSRRGGDIISKVTNADYWDLEHCATLGAPRSPHSPQLSLDGVLDRRRCGPRRRSAHHPHPRLSLRLPVTLPSNLNTSPTRSPCLSQAAPRPPQTLPAGLIA